MTEQPPRIVTLYGAAACHLCELAEQVVQAGQQQWPGLHCRKVDIAGDKELLRRYRLRIPVLRFEDGRELGWPFDLNALLAELAGSAGHFANEEEAR